MFQYTHPEVEVTYRQQQVHTGFIEAQRQISVAGIRQILGNTVLELGSRIHGMAQVACPAAAETQGLVRDVRQESVPNVNRILIPAP